MKRNTILLFAAVTILFGALINSCNENKDEPGDKGDKNEYNLQNNNNDAYMSDIDDYRTETDAQFAANDSILADFRDRMQN